MINNIDINEILVSKKFPFCKQDFKYFIGYKDNKEIRPLCIVFLEMNIYKRYSDNTKCMCFTIKDEKILMSMTFWEKVIHLHIPITLLDSVYRKDGSH